MRVPHPHLLDVRVIYPPGLRNFCVADAASARVARAIGSIAHAAGLLPFHLSEPGSDVGELWVKGAGLGESHAGFDQLSLS